MRKKILAVVVVLTALGAASASGATTPDPGFGGGGTVTVPVGTSYTVPIDLEVDSADQPLTLLSTSAGYAVARLLPAGAVDSAFAGDGIAELPAGFFATDLATGPTGEVLVTGTFRRGEGPLSDGALVRLTATGARDGTFGSDGLLVLAGGDAGSQIDSLEVLADRRMVLTRQDYAGSGTNVQITLTLHRLLANGSPDTSFGSGGSVVLAPEPGGLFAFGVDLDVDRSGRANVAITTFITPTGTETRLAVARFLVDGNPDPAFGQGGVAHLGMGSGLDLDVSPYDGGVYVVGNQSWLLGGPIAWRLDAFGRRDRTWGNDGVVRVPIRGPVPNPAGVVALPTGHVVIAGSIGAAASGEPGVVAVSLVRRDGSFEPSFGTDGTLTITDFTSHLSIAVREYDQLLVAGRRGNAPTEFDVRAFRLGLPPVTPGPAVNRIAGEDRIATAIAIAQTAFPDPGSANAVVLTRSDAFPDALAGTPLAARIGAPILLTPSSSLDPRVLAEIRRALPAGGSVTILGGTSAIASSVDSQLVAAGFQVGRYAGADRFETAVVIATQGLGAPNRVLLATGTNFPDSLAAGAAAAHIGAALLLTNGSVLPSATSAYLAARPTASVTAVGGPAAVARPDAQAIVGADRFATAVGVAETLFGPVVTDVGVASGANFPDALAGGAEIARRGGPMLLSLPTGAPAVLLQYLADRQPQRVTVYGGTQAVAGIG